VFSLTEIGGNTPAAIEAFLQNAYYNWTTKPVGVLLLEITAQHNPTPLFHRN